MTTIVDPTHDDLNQLMDFGHIVYVGHTADGFPYVTDAWADNLRPPEAAPEGNVVIIQIDDAAESQLKAALPTGWAYVNGYSGQDRYSGPVMHDSEFIGGALADAILEHAGFYVTSYVDYYDDGEEPYTEGWVLAYFGPDIV